MTDPASSQPSLTLQELEEFEAKVLMDVRTYFPLAEIYRTRYKNLLADELGGLEKKVVIYLNMEEDGGAAHVQLQFDASSESEVKLYVEYYGSVAQYLTYVNLGGSAAFNVMVHLTKRPRRNPPRIAARLARERIKKMISDMATAMTCAKTILSSAMVPDVSWDVVTWFGFPVSVLEALAIKYPTDKVVHSSVGPVVRVGDLGVTLVRLCDTIHS